MEGNTLQIQRDDADHLTKASSTSVTDHREPILSLTPEPRHAAEQESPWGARIRIGVILFAVLWMLLVGAMWSRAASAADSTDYYQKNSSSDGNEYSFKWLDPEKKIYVLQNRRYTKAKHLMLSLLAGPGFSNPYRSTFSLEPRLAYYFSEAWGLEVFYDKVFNSNNNTYNALLSTGTNVFPVIRQINSELGAMVQWVPWYAKINVFNNILYFDWYFAGGVGTVQSAVTTGTDKASLDNFTTQDKFATYLGTGHLYHITDRFTVRLDFMGTFYRAPLNGTSGDNVWFTNYDITIGLGVRL